MTDPSPADGPTKAQIDRINEISQLARTAWFSLIAYLLFVGITLLGVEDADFFVPTRQTQLPLVDVQIPTASFFYAAPILGAALYTYLHLFLIKLWEAHGEARTRDADPTHHWLVNDYVLIRQGDPTARARPLSWLVGSITLLLVWLAGPIVLGYAWWRSMPAHNEWMTLLIAACFFTTLVVGFTSWTTARARLHDNRRPPGRRPAQARGRRVRAGPRRRQLAPHRRRRSIVTSAPFPSTDTSCVAPTDLSTRPPLRGEPPADWREHDYARGRYREDWCERHEVPLATCEHIGTMGDADSGDVEHGAHRMVQAGRHRR